MTVKSQSEVAQSCPTRSDPMDCSLPGSSVHGICQARVVEWGKTIPRARQMLYDLSHMWNLKQMQAHRYREQLVVATSKGVGRGGYGGRGFLKKKKEENSLAIQSLGLSALTARPGVQSLVGELRSYMPRGAPKKIKTNLSKKKVLYLKSNQSACKLKPVTNHSTSI